MERRMGKVMWLTIGREKRIRKKTLCKGGRELVDKGQGQIYEKLSVVRIREQTEIFTSPFYYPSRKFA